MTGLNITQLAEDEQVVAWWKSFNFAALTSKRANFLKQREMVGSLTSMAPTLIGGTCVTESHILTLTDSIMLPRDVELYGKVGRGLTVLKMRGSMPDKEIREFSLDNTGMHIGKPFRNVLGILSGSPA